MNNCFIAGKTDFSRRSFDNITQRYTHQIAIRAKTAGGKSMFLDGLEAHLPKWFKFASAGAIVRERGKELGMEIEAFTTHIREHPEQGHDEYCDALMYQRTWGINHFIGEGRLVHLTMPRACKVLIDCPIRIRAERRHRTLVKKAIAEGKPVPTYEKTLMDILNRDSDDEERYDRMYPGWNWAKADYDIVICNAPNRTQEEVVDLLLDKHTEWLEKVRQNSLQLVVGEL